MKWYYRVMAGITTAVLTSPVFSATVGTDSDSGGGGVIGQSLAKIAQGFGEGAKSGLSSGKYIVAFGMFILLFVILVIGATGGIMWYTRTKGNPQQPANWVIAGLWGFGGALIGFGIWLFIYMVLKAFNIDVVQIWSSV